MIRFNELNIGDLFMINSGSLYKKIFPIETEYSILNSIRDRFRFVHIESDTIVCPCGRMD